MRPKKLLSETTNNNNIYQIWTKAAPPNLETNKELSADYKLNESEKITHILPPLLNKTIPHTRVDKPMQKPSDTNNINTRPTPMVIPPRRSPRLMAEAYQKIKESDFPRVEETIKMTSRHNMHQRTALESERVSNH